MTFMGSWICWLRLSAGNPHRASVLGSGRHADDRDVRFCIASGVRLGDLGRRMIRRPSDVVIGVIRREIA